MVIEMNNPREAIISTLHERLQPDPRILAMWLEGADATNTVDEYSDIDICCSVEAGAMEAVTDSAREAIESLGSADLIQTLEDRENQRHTIFHLEGTSEYLLIDFVAYIGSGSQFIAGDTIEKPLILFDRGGVIQFEDPAARLASMRREERLQELAQTVAQFSRIEKYVRRGDFLEAFGYYHRWLLTPLVEVLRMRYTPLHPDYYIVHISRHLPGDVLTRLEALFKVNSVDEIEFKSREAKTLFEATAAFLKNNA